MSSKTKKSTKNAAAMEKARQRDELQQRQMEGKGAANYQPEVNMSTSGLGCSSGSGPVTGGPAPNSSQTSGFDPKEQAVALGGDTLCPPLPSIPAKKPVPAPAKAPAPAPAPRSLKKRLPPTFKQKIRKT